MISAGRQVVLERLAQGATHRSAILDIAGPGVAGRRAVGRDISRLLGEERIEVDVDGWLSLPDGPFPPPPAPPAGPDARWWTPSEDGRTWTADLLGLHAVLTLGEDGHSWTVRLSLPGDRIEDLEMTYATAGDASRAAEERLIEVDGLRVVLSHPGRDRDGDGIQRTATAAEPEEDVPSLSEV